MRTITLSAKLDERRKKEKTQTYKLLCCGFCVVWGMEGRHNKNLSLAGTTIFRSKNLKRKIIKERFMAIQRSSCQPVTQIFVIIEKEVFSCQSDEATWFSLARKLLLHSP